MADGAGRQAVGELVLAHGDIVLADARIRGHLKIENGLIADISTGAVPRGAIDMEGDLLIPGLVDLHTDHFEKHIHPRPHVTWDFRRALLAHDAQIIGAGITTVFDSLYVGATHENPDRRKILGPMIAALEESVGADELRAQHLVHLRCEITDEETPGLLSQHIKRDIVALASVMDHLPGDRQNRDISAYLKRQMKRFGLNEAGAMKLIEDVRRANAGTGARVRPLVVKAIREAALPLMTHDDADVQHVEEAYAEGAVAAEFPVSIEAARHARTVGLTVVAGAPNVLCGGSQSGNVAVKDLMAERLVDILASDYVPRSMLDAVFEIANNPIFGLDLPATVRLVTRNPAELSGLKDRGEIAIGRRADLLRLSMVRQQPILRQVWRAGRQVY